MPLSDITMWLKPGVRSCGFQWGKPKVNQKCLGLVTWRWKFLFQYSASSFFHQQLMDKIDKMDKILLVFSKSHMSMVHISQHNLYLILSWKRVCHHCTGVCPAQLLEFSGLRWTHCCLAGMEFRGWHQLSLSLSPGIPKWSYRSAGVCWLGGDIHWIFESVFMYQSHLLKWSVSCEE